MAAPSFLGYLRDYRKRSGFTMHLEHKVGEKVFVDFCGAGLSIVEEPQAILGCSQLTYVQAVLSQKKEDFTQPAAPPALIIPSVYPKPLCPG